MEITKLVIITNVSLLKKKVKFTISQATLSQSSALVRGAHLRFNGSELTVERSPMLWAIHQTLSHNLPLPSQPKIGTHLPTPEG